MHERGGGRRGIYVLRNAISAVIHLDRQCSEGFFFSSISFFLSFSLFFTFFTKALHESSQKMASTSQCVVMWQTVRSGCTAGGRAGYVAASESVSSSFCAVSLEKILHGLRDRPKTPELCRSSAWTATHDLGLLFVRQRNSDGGGKKSKSSKD